MKKTNAKIDSKLNTAVIRFIICVLNALAIAVLLIFQIIRGARISYALVLMLPILFYISSKDLFYIISADFSRVKESAHGYFKFMKNAGAKYYQPKDRARSLYKKYSNKTPGSYNEIKEALAEELRNEKPDRLSVSVLCGLLFSYNERSDSETLFRAKYSYGSAGELVYEEWIDVLSSEVEQNAEKSAACIVEFNDYWERF